MGILEVSMYCKNCGTELNENDRVCPDCGTPVDKTAPKGAPNNGPQTYAYSDNSSASNQTYQYSGPNYQPSADSGSKGWGLLGCCFPLIGLILFLVWKDEKLWVSVPSSAWCFVSSPFCCCLHWASAWVRLASLKEFTAEIWTSANWKTISARILLL